MPVWPVHNDWQTLSVKEIDTHPRLLLVHFCYVLYLNAIEEDPHTDVVSYRIS